MSRATEAKLELAAATFGILLVVADLTTCITLNGFGEGLAVSLLVAMIGFLCLIILGIIGFGIGVIVEWFVDTFREAYGDQD